MIGRFCFYSLYSIIIHMWKKHKNLWGQKSFCLSFGFGLVLALITFTANYFANLYAISHSDNTVSDIILDNLPAQDVTSIFLGGAVILLILLLIIFIREPKYIPFSLKSVSLFYLVRSFFLILTHLAPPFNNTISYSNSFTLLSSGYDLFFSGHTGLPFLFALIFWETKSLRYLFFAGAIFGGVSVLLGHLHYSIDVFAAPFIAFGIYHLAKNLFVTDHKLTQT